MRYLAYLAIATYITISVLVSIRKEWFGFIYSIPGKDLLAHFVGMGLLTFFMVLGFSRRSRHGRAYSPLASMAFATLLVLLDEVSQLAIPARTFALIDLAWSLAGILIFGLATAVIEWVMQLRSRNSTMSS